MQLIKEYSHLWWGTQNIMRHEFTCGYCGAFVASTEGMPLKTAHTNGQDTDNGVYVCSNCKMPSFFWGDVQVPGNRFGGSVKHISANLSDIYNEARNAYSVNAFTGTVLLCRRLLMDIAIELGANDNLKFIEYVNYLDENNFITAKSKDWVDAIRKEGNDATHNVVVKDQKQAADMIMLCEMIMKINFEYPAQFTNQ
jgi:hypothetical protein